MTPDEAQGLLGRWNALEASEQSEAGRLALDAIDRSYASSAWEWAVDLVVTLDEATNSIRPFPAKEKAFGRELFQQFDAEKWVVLPKSRREFASWLAAIWLVHRARYSPVFAGFWSSANEDRAALAVQDRCVFIEENLRMPELRRKLDKHRTAKGLVGRANWSAHSYIYAIPAGGDVLRGPTPSAVVQDEFDFQPDADKAQQAAVPLIRDGLTKFIQITTSNGPAAPVARHCKEIGFIRWEGHNRKPGTLLTKYRSNRGAVIIPLHYSLDEAHDEAWVAATRAACSTENEFAREYEIDFGSWVGALAYPNFSNANRGRGYVVNPDLPICLCVDFNVQPMIWAVGQVVNGRPRAIQQIKIADNATVEKMVRIFRDTYPTHELPVRVYGDASGNNRTAQTAQSDYDLMRLAFKGYGAQLEFYIPSKNPGVKVRLAAVNRALRGDQGVPWLTADEDDCPDLIQDWLECAMNKDGTDLLKVWKPTDPYHERTHISDAVGYWIWREWAVATEAQTPLEKRKLPEQKPVLYGDLAD